MANFSIIGAGISGLSLAYFLKQNGHCVKIYESSSGCGGLIQNESTPYGLIHHGPHLMRTSLEIQSFFSEISVQTLPAINTKKYIGNFAQNQFTPIKPSFLQFLQIIKHLFHSKKPSYSSLESFASRHFSPFVAQNFIQSICNGVYATSINQLHHEIALKKLYFTEKKAIYKILKSLPKAQKQQIITILGGFSTITKSLATILKAHITYNTPIANISALENPIITIPAFHAQNLQGISSETKNLLSLVSYSSVTVTTIFTKTPINLQGIGILTPAQTGILGILFNTSAFQNSNSESSQNGFHSYSVFSKNLEEGQVNETFSKTFGVNIEKSFHNSYTNSIPIYNSHIQNFINHNNANQTNTRFFANYTGCVAIGEIILAAKKLAEKLT